MAFIYLKNGFKILSVRIYLSQKHFKIWDKIVPIFSLSPTCLFIHCHRYRYRFYFYPYYCHYLPLNVQVLRHLLVCVCVFLDQHSAFF